MLQNNILINLRHAVPCIVRMAIILYTSSSLHTFRILGIALRHSMVRFWRVFIRNSSFVIRNLRFEKAHK